MQDLIIKYLNKELTAEEKTKLFTALETNTVLRKEFESMQNTYALAALMPSDADVALGVDKLLSFKQAHCLKRQYSLPWKHIMGYAATVCIAVAITWFITDKKEQPVLALPVVTFEEFSTPSGQRAMLKLHDGTTVWLNAGSTLRYPNVFDEKQRRVELDGEAFFDVTHVNDKPFLVATDKADIKVLGTKFNVFAYKNSMDFNTTLVDGEVAVYTPGREQLMTSLKPNESVTIVHGAFRKTVPDNFDFLLWKEGIYAFDDETFAEIMKKLELYYNVTIVQTNKQLDKFRFSGKFRQRDGIESVLRTLQKIYKFSYQKDDEKNQITIR